MKKTHLICWISLFIASFLLTHFITTHYPWLEIKEEIYWQDVEGISWTRIADEQFCEHTLKEGKTIEALKLEKDNSAWWIINTSTTILAYPCYTKTYIRHWENIWK